MSLEDWISNDHTQHVVDFKGMLWQMRVRPIDIPFYVRSKMSKKVAILHDWLVGFRGGERMLEAFCEMFPEADIYTLLHKKGSVPATIEKHKIYCSYLNKIPGIYENYRKYLPLFPLAVDTLNFKDKYDLIISSSHCVIKGMKKPKNAVHVSYVYTPMRYMYDQFDVYFGEEAPLYQRIGAKVVRPYITHWDKKSNKDIDVMLGISHFVSQRIFDIYQIKAPVVYPFVDLKDFSQLDLNAKKSQDFYLMVSAFAPNKRCDLAIEAFNLSGKKLKIVGGGQQDEYLRSIARKNIEFLGILDREEIIKLYYLAKAFIFPGVEDFGITPLESLAAGTPVICYQQGGGVRETMTNDTAVFFNEPTAKAMNQAIQEFEQRVFDPQSLLKRAQEFSKDRFVREMADVIEHALVDKSL